MEKDSIEEEKNNHTSSIVTPVAKSVPSLVKIDSISIDLGKSMDKTVTDKCHHFSLRQYCADMRIKDVRICAPFARDGDDEAKLREQLAPLHVPQFRRWCCQSCVQDASASQSHQDIERTSPSPIRGEIHPSSCSNKEKDDALVGPSAVHGPDNGVRDFSSQQICDQTLSPANPARHTDDPVGEGSVSRELELANVCVLEHASNVAATDVLAIEYPGCKSNKSSEKCPAERADTIDGDLMIAVVANETSNKDIEINASNSAKDAGAMKKASYRRRKKKVRLITEISDQLASHNATPNECAAPASNSASRKRKINQEPSKEKQLPSRKPKKVRATKGDAITTIATIHNSDSESVEDDASAGTGFKSHVSLQKSGNESCSSKLKTKMSHGEDKQGSYKRINRGNYKEDIGLDLSLNSYQEVDKINTLVPNKKTTLNNDHWIKKGSRTVPSSVPDFSFSKDIEEDVSGRIAYSTDINCLQEDSPSLRKKLELSLGCNNKKAATPKRFTAVSRNGIDERSETVFELRSYDDIPMEIVELMAKHQYERGLSEAERNSCLTKRINERNYEMMGLDVYNNHSVVGNRGELHVMPMFGTCLQTQQKDGKCLQTQQKESASAQRPQTSTSRTFINNATQNLLRSGDRLVHRSSPAYSQVTDTYNTANNGPQQSGMAGNTWASGASSLVPPNPNFADNIASGTSNMTTYLPYTDLHKGKTVLDLDLNRADPNDSDVEVLSGCPVASNAGSYLNLKEMNSLHSFSNEAIPAMQLLSLMDAGTSSRSPVSINVKKLHERPFFPCNDRPSIGMDKRANLFEKPLFPQNYQVKGHSGPGPSLYKSSASTTQMPSAYSGPNLFTSQHPEKASWMVRTPLGTAAVSDMIPGCNLHQGKQKGILGSSVDVIFPLQPEALNITENCKDVGSCQMHGTIKPLRDISKEEMCSVNRNPADFTIPEAGNMYMICGGDLKFGKDYLVSRVSGFDGQMRHGLKLKASKRQARGRGPTVFP